MGGSDSAQNYRVTGLAEIEAPVSQLHQATGNARD